MNKYKLVKFDESQRVEFTVESDNEKELRQAAESFGIRLTKTLVEKPLNGPTVKEAPVRQTPDEYQEKVDNHICVTHNVPLVESISKTKFEDDGVTPKRYWSHTAKIDGKFSRCFGKGKGWQ